MQLLVMPPGCKAERGFLGSMVRMLGAGSKPFSFVAALSFLCSSWMKSRP